MNKNNTTTAKNMNINTIAFSKGYLRVKEYDTTVDFANTYLKSLEGLSPLVMAMQAELMRYGLMFDAECLYYLERMETEELEVLADDLADYLGDAYGDGCFVSLFGNFPQTVMMMSEAEMFFHQIVHYLSGGAYSPAMPSCDDTELALLHDRYDGVTFRDSYKLIRPISNEDFVAYFKKILSAQQSLTSYDKEVVSYLIDNYSEVVDKVEDLIPEEVPFKETLCFLFSKVDGIYPKTVTDVLRYAVYLSGGDVALPKIPTSLDYGWGNYDSSWPQYMKDHYNRNLQNARAPFKFKKFSRPERRQILGMIEHLFEEQIALGKQGDNILADMKKYSERWVRLAEILHPGEYQKKFPHTYEAFDVVRNSAQYISTYYGRVNAARQSNDIKLLIAVFTERPGEFARNIDNLLRNYPSEANYILDAFAKVLPEISVKMLYELLDHFYVRNDAEFREERYVMGKGARTPYKLPLIPKLDEEVLTKLMSLFTRELSKRHAELGSLAGKTYIVDNKISNIALPKNMRSMNIAPGQIARGSALPIKTTTGIFRCYCRWVDKFGRYDLDLSTMMYDKDFKYLASISWNTYYKQEDWAVFSGDVRHRQGNCAEYIDIDVNKAKNAGVRYIVASVNDFDGTGFVKKDAWAGVMERDSFGTPGELTWAPKTITTGFKLTSACTNIVMTVIDLEKMVMYVVDEDITGIPVASRSINTLGMVAKRYATQKRFFNGHSLIAFSVDARGGNILSVEHDNVEEVKANLAAAKKRFLELKKNYEDELCNLPESSDIERIDARNNLRQNLNQIEIELEKINNTEIISYDDIASDYTKLLAWMF